MGWKASSGRPSWGGFFLFNRGVWQIPQHQAARPSTIVHMIGIEFGGSTMTTPSDKNTLYVLISKLGRYSPEPSRDMVLRRSLLCAADGRLGRTVICRTDQAPFFISFWAWPQRGCCERTPKSRKGSSDPLKELLRSPKPVAGGSLPPSKARQGNVRRDRSI